MDCKKAVRDYLLDLIEQTGEGQIKTLILDEETTKITSLSFAQSDLLKKEIYLFERLDSKKRCNMQNVTAIVFVRPTRENFDLLIRELRSPPYKAYHIYFSSTIDRQHLKELAESDVKEVVQTVQEIFADYNPYSAHLFTIPLNKMNPFNIDETDLRRTSEGLMALLLSLRKYPASIKFSKTSSTCHKLAERISSVISREYELFHQAGKNDCTLLLLDRRDDVTTPLLMQWTYQAMLHEILGITNNCIDMSSVSGVPKELHKIMLNVEQDDFFAQNMYLNFGEIGSNIKQLVESFTKQKSITQKVDSIQDMKNFVEMYPAFKKQSGTVNKHVILVEELSKRTAKNKLLNISEVEQNLCVEEDHSAIVQSLRDLIDEKDISGSNILRLVCLYAIKYGSQNEQTLRSLSAAACQAKSINRSEFDQKIRAVRDYAMTQSYQESSQEKVLGGVKKLIRGVKGVENIYTQHIPSFKSLIEKVCQGKSDPRLKTFGANPQTPLSKDVIVFISGGVTYEESFHIYRLNKEVQDQSRIVIGGNIIHNSRSFLNDILYHSESARQLPDAV